MNDDAAPTAVAWIAVGAAVACLTVALWSSAQLRELAGSVAAALPTILVVAVVVLVVTGSRIRVPPGRLRRLGAPLAFGGCVSAFVLATFAAWERARSPLAIGGAVPVTDGGLYLGGAQRYLFDGGFDQFNGRRPLNALFLAVRLAVSDLDLRVAMLLQATLIGVACFFAARAVARDLGAVGGLALFAGLYTFAYPTAASTLSEGSGVLFGTLAFAVLWVGVRERRLVLVTTGLGLFTAAQGFRPSSFTLPFVLAVWCAFALRTTGRFDRRVLAFGLGAVVVGLGLNVVGVVEGGTSLRNLGGSGAYGIYGLARGVPSWKTEGTPGWTMIYVDHGAEMAARTEVERSAFVAAHARDEVLDHPRVFLFTTVASYGHYLRVAWRATVAPLSGQALRVAFAGTTLAIAAVGFYRRRRIGWRELSADACLLVGSFLAVPVMVQTWADLLPFEWFGVLAVGAAVAAFAVLGSAGVLGARLRQLTIVALVALALELPLLGPDNTRVFAAVAPFLMLPFAIAAARLRAAIAARARPELATRPVAPVSSPGARWAPAVIAGVLLVVTLAGAPVAAALVDRPAAPSPATCDDGAPALPLVVASHVVITDEPSAVDEVRTEVPPEPDVPFFADLDRAFYADVASTPGADSMVIAGITPTSDDRLVFVDQPVPLDDGSSVLVCGRPVGGYVSFALSQTYAQPIGFEVLQGVVVDR